MRKKKWNEVAGISGVHFVITINIGFNSDYLCRSSAIVATGLIKIDKIGSWLLIVSIAHYYLNVCVCVYVELCSW